MKRLVSAVAAGAVVLGIACTASASDTAQYPPWVCEKFAERNYYPPKCPPKPTTTTTSTTTTTAPTTTTTTTLPPTTTSTTTSTTSTTAPTTTTVPGSVYTIPATIADDCSTDVGAEINAWIASVPDGSTLLFGGGCFLTEETIWVDWRHGLTLDGQGAELRSETSGYDATPTPGNDHVWPRERAHILLNEGSNLTVRGFHMNGPDEDCLYDGQGLEEQSFVHVDGVQTALIENLSGGGVHGDFVSVQGGAPVGPHPTPARDITIRNNDFECAGRQGIAAVEVLGMLVEGNTLRKVGRSIFDLETAVPWWQIRNVTITDNDVYEIGDGVFFANRGEGGLVSDISVTNNRGHQVPLTVTASGHESYGQRRHNYVFSDNWSDAGHGTSNATIYFHMIDDIEVARNTQVIAASYPGAYSGIAVLADDVQGITVRENVFQRWRGMMDPALIGPVYPLELRAGATADLVCGNITSDHGEPLGPPVDGPCP